MSQPDNDLILSGVERRLAAVEALIPSRSAWRSAEDHAMRPGLVRVVAGPARRQGPRAGRGLGLLFAVGAVIVVMLAYGLSGGGGRPSPVPSESVPSPTAGATSEPTVEAGALRPLVEPRLTIPVRPETAWTVVEDGPALVSLVYLLDDVGSLGYNVSLSVMEPQAVYDPVVETKRLPLPADLIGWIRDHPDLEAGEPAQLTVAGLPATAIDVTVTYPPDGPKGQTAQFIDIGAGSWNLELGIRKRIVLVELPDRPLLIVFESRPEFFDGAIGHFEDELALIRFEERGQSP
jgi:hypothetical protein